MSPFSTYFRYIRDKYRIPQRVLAEKLGYEQSYVSALEVGTKGPPTEAFVAKLIQVLSLDPTEAQQLREAAEVSRRKFQIPVDAPLGVYLMCGELRRQLAHLHPAQIEAITAILRLSSSLKEPEGFGSDFQLWENYQKREVPMRSS